MTKKLLIGITCLVLAGCWGGGGSSGGSKNVFGAPPCDNPDCYSDPVDYVDNPNDANFDVVITDTVVDEGDYDDGSGGEEVVDIKGTATISWIAPTRNDDATEENPLGTLLTNLAGFKIKYGDFPGEYPIVIPITNIGLASYFIDDLDQGDWFFVMTAYNTWGGESKPSIEVFKQIK
jgi:hypothetical protein